MICPNCVCITEYEEDAPCGWVACLRSTHVKRPVVFHLAPRGRGDLAHPTCLTMPLLLVDPSPAQPPMSVLIPAPWPSPRCPGFSPCLLLVRLQSSFKMPLLCPPLLPFQFHPCTTQIKASDPLVCILITVSIGLFSHPPLRVRSLVIHS